MNVDLFETVSMTLLLAVVP